MHVATAGSVIASQLTARRIAPHLRRCAIKAALTVSSAAQTALSRLTGPAALRIPFLTVPRCVTRTVRLRISPVTRATPCPRRDSTRRQSNCHSSHIRPALKSNRGLTRIPPSVSSGSHCNGLHFYWRLIGFLAGIAGNHEMP